MTRLGVALAVALLGAAAAGQDLGPKAPAQEGVVALVNARVHPVSGPAIERGHVVFSKGRIIAVGAGDPAALPADARVLDLSGRRVYPGLVAAHSRLGLTEIGSVRATRDFEEHEAVVPELRAAPAINPDSTLIPVARSNGILTAGIFPAGKALPGRVSVIRLDGWTWADMTVKADAGMVVVWPNMRVVRAWWMEKSEEEQKRESAANLERIRGAFAEARAYGRARAADPEVPVDIRWEAVLPSFPAAGRSPRPVFFQANTRDQIADSLAFAEEYGLRPVIVGGRDAPLLASRLKALDAPVVVNGTFGMPKRVDSDYDERFRLPAILEAAGIRWCLASGQGPANERNLPYAAAMAVAYGLPEAAAIRSITLSAAEILGVGDELGSLEKGKAATLIVTDGDPLEITTHVVAAYIDGRKIDLANKQTALYEKYREKYRQLGLLPR